MKQQHSGPRANFAEAVRHVRTPLLHSNQHEQVWLSYLGCPILAGSVYTRARAHGVFFTALQSVMCFFQSTSWCRIPRSVLVQVRTPLLYSNQHDLAVSGQNLSAMPAIIHTLLSNESVQCLHWTSAFARKDSRLVCALWWIFRRCNQELRSISKWKQMLEFVPLPALP